MAVGNIRRFLEERGMAPAREATGRGKDFIDELTGAGVALRHD
jgi:hypothetical protein